MRALFAEMMGRATGLCGGRGGSQHIHWRNLYSNGVQGGIVPIAVGMALAEKEKQSGALVTVFIGDGTFGEGALYEACNMASLWRVPLLIVVENNHIAQTTPTTLVMVGGIAERLRAFDIPVTELDTSDACEIQQAALKCVTGIRNTSQPQALVLNTVRFGPHSKGDDTRAEAVLRDLRATRDPLKILAARLPQETLTQLHNEVELEVMRAFELALSDPQAVLEEEG